MIQWILRILSAPTMTTTMVRIMLQSNFVLFEGFGAAGGVVVVLESSSAGGVDGSFAAGSDSFATGGNGGSTKSIASMVGIGAGFGGFAATPFANMSPGMIGSIVNGRSAFGSAHFVSAAEKIIRLRLRGAS